LASPAYTTEADRAELRVQLKEIDDTLAMQQVAVERQELETRNVLPMLIDRHPSFFGEYRMKTGDGSKSIPAQPYVRARAIEARILAQE